MKRNSWRPSTLIVIAAIGTLGLSILAAQQLAPTKTAGAPKTIVASADFALSSLATHASDRLNIAPHHPWNKYATLAPLYYDREQVEVIARSVTFPSVLSQGELILGFEFPNATILCLDTAYYAGKVQGLILAMDRDTVVENRLYWTIDDATDLFHGCLDIYLQEAVDEPESNDKGQLEHVREVLSGQVEFIQETLRFAKDVKIKRGRPFVAVGLKKPATQDAAGPLP